jgi:hypothetical protein
MAYSIFTVKQVEQQFNLQIITDSFLPTIPLLAPSPNLAELLQRTASFAAMRFNQADGQDIPCIYGSVTTGTQWQFLRLTGQEIWIDVTEYALMPLDRILGILKWMLEN